MKKVIRNIIAIILIITGIIGSLIPIMQGWVFVLTGFIMLDFKKKDAYEEKIIKVMSKTRIGKKMADLWIYVKRVNKNIIEKERKEKIRNIYRDINKDIY